jgi:hypothetical protein
VLIAHLAFDFGAGDQGCHRVDHDETHGTRAQQDIGDLEGLLPRVGLGDQQVLDLDAEPARVADVEGVFRIDEGRDTSTTLPLG